MSRYAVEPVEHFGIVKGWKIKNTATGDALHGFVTRAEAERLLKFFNTEAD
ncbi:MAG: hypothetical protein L0Y56_10100 [Nitrospira sp.]|nr:hypothetical protein [Nitrospira sp.]